MRRLGLILAFLALAASADDAPRARDGRSALRGRGPLSRTSCVAGAANLLTFPEAFDNAAWSKDANPTAPTVTANFAAAPDGTLTADRIQSAATSGTQSSEVYQGPFIGTGSMTCSFHVRGNGTSGTTDVCIYAGGAAWHCGNCAFTATDSKCTFTLTTDIVGTSRYCKIGNNSGQNGGVARAANDMIVWGGKAENGTSATAYTSVAGVCVP